MPETTADSTNPDPATPFGPEYVPPVPPVWMARPSRLRRVAHFTGVIALGILLGTSAVGFAVAATDVWLLILDALHNALTAHYCVLPGGR